MRKLNDKDNEILQKLAPEASIPTHYRSILPPVSMHFAADDKDLQDRLKRLSKCLKRFQKEIDMVKGDPEECRSAFYINVNNESQWVMWTKERSYIPLRVQRKPSIRCPKD